MAVRVVSKGEAVYVRACSTKRSAIAEVIELFQAAGRRWSRVRLLTDWHDWDGVQSECGEPPRSGELLQLEEFRLEPIRQ